MSSLRDSPRHRTLQQEVADWLTGAILTARLGPGDRVSAEMIAQELGMSHIPVREALQVLEGEGRLERQPRRGFFLPALSPEEIEAIYHWRGVIEAEGCRLALPSVTPADVEAMAALLGRMREAAERNDPVAYSQAHRRFHRAPLAHLPNRLPLRFLDYLWDEAERYALPHLRPDVELPRLAEQHERLLGAFRDGDLAAVLAIMEEHRRLTLQRCRDGAGADGG
jgi:DNA-binding GntR family transcriptional regulator